MNPHSTEARYVVEHDSALSAWGQVHRDLMTRIESGAFAVGQRISSEAALVAHYGVSRPTIRRATRELVADGYLIIRQGAGTFVRDRGDVRCDLDIRLPWRKQIVSTGHRAVSELIELRPGESVPVDVASLVESTAPLAPALYGRHLQLVDGIPIAVTESWYSRQEGELDTASETISVEESGLVEVKMTTASQAKTLRSFLDIPLIVVTTVSRDARSGAVIEISRTSWLASRVRLLHSRTVTLADLDMSQLLSERFSRHST